MVHMAAEVLGWHVAVRRHLGLDMAFRSDASGKWRNIMNKPGTAAFCAYPELHVQPKSSTPGA